MTTSAAGAPLNVRLRPELPAEALHGLAGEITRHLAESTGADPAAILLATLAMAGNAVGPSPAVRFGGGAEHPARLDVVIVGDAARGRKGTAVDAVAALFGEADPAWADTRIMRGLMSPEAMIDRVDDDRSDDCWLLVLESEFAKLIKKMNSGGFSQELRNAWDGKKPQTATKDKKKSRCATRPHISLIGMITPNELSRYHGVLADAGGLESRILYGWSAPWNDTSPFTSPEAGTTDLADRLRKALEYSHEAVLQNTDPVSRHLLIARGIQPSVELPLAEEVRVLWQERRRRPPGARAGLPVGLRGPRPDPRQEL